MGDRISEIEIGNRESKLGRHATLGMIAAALGPAALAVLHRFLAVRAAIPAAGLGLTIAGGMIALVSDRVGNG